MWTEGEIQNFKKIFLDETRCYGHQDVAKKVFDESFGRVRNIDFSQFQDKEEVFVKVAEALEILAEGVAFLKDNLDNGASPEESFT